MNNIAQDAKTDPGMQDEISTLEKLTQSYLSLKQKICSAHEVIKQYNDKSKECERLKSELNSMTKQANKATFNYNTTLAKVLKLELQNNEYQKNVEALTATVKSHEVKMAADNQHIQQLTCKISEIEKQHSENIMKYDLEKSSLQVKIKELEQELKTVKKSHETKMKKMEKKLVTESAEKKAEKTTVIVTKSDVAVNTAPFHELIKPKPKMVDKSIVTKESYNIKDDVYPIFCAKCETGISPAPLDKICQIMQNECPVPVERIRSPSPRQTSSPLPKLLNMSDDQCKVENVSDTCSQPHDQNSGNNFSLTTVLPPPSPIAPLQTTFYEEVTLPPKICNLMDHGKYYIPMTENKHLPNPPNQNHRCIDAAAIGPPLPVIESLEKRIGTLETKLKKQLKKQRAMQNSNWWQHKHPMNCCRYEINNSIQSNTTLDLMQKMIELCSRSEQKNVDLYQKYMMAKLNKRKINKVMRQKSKRLQPATGGIWEIQTTPQKIDQVTVQSRPKKRKLRQSNRSDHYNTSADNSVHMESESLYPSSPMYNSTETSPSNTQILRSTKKSRKSTPTETDSGLSSDCVESCKLMPPDIDTVKCQDLIEEKSTVKLKSNVTCQSAETEAPITKCTVYENVKNPENPEIPENPENPENPEIPEMAAEKREEEVLDLKSMKADVVSSHTEESYSTISEVPRKRGRPPKNKSEGRQELLKKIRNLKRPLKSSAACNALFENPKLNECESEHSHTNTDINMDELRDEVYAPRKRARIAHTPKNNSANTNTSPKKQDVFMNENINGECAMNNRKRSVSPIVSNKDEGCTKEPKKIHEMVTRRSSTSIQAKKVNDINSIVNPSIVINTDVQINDSKKKTEVQTTAVSYKASDHYSTEENNNPKNEELHAPPANETLHALLANETLHIPPANETLHTPPANEALHAPPANEALHAPPANEVSEPVLNNSSNLGMGLDRQVEPITNNTAEELNISTSTTETADSLIIEPTVNEEISDLKPDFCKYNFESSQTHEDSYVNNSYTDKSLPACPAAYGEDIKKPDGSKNKSNLIEKRKCENIVSVDYQTNGMAFVPMNGEETEIVAPLSVVTYCLSEKKCVKPKKKKKKNLTRSIELIDKHVKDQLEKLVNSPWEVTIHTEILEQLKKVSSAQIIAKCIIEFLSTGEEYNVTLDKTYTPPAPLMTKAQQRIATLLMDLKETYPNIIQLVQDGIEYEMFRPNTSHERQVLDSLSRMYTVLARMQKDREKVRIFCCDAMYFLCLNSITVLYTVLTCWPEVFPISTSTNDVLPKCIAHFILSQQVTYPFPKLNALKNLITLFYQYPTGSLTKDILAELLSKLQEKPYDGLETALILLAKRENTTWTHKNLIQGALLPLIITKSLPCNYKAFCLLGNLLRPFPKEDSDNVVGTIVEQLRDLINSGEIECPDQEEGIISALVSLSRQKFDITAETVLKWTPRKPMRERTTEQIKGFFRLRYPEFWRGFLKKHKNSLTQIQRENN